MGPTGAGKTTLVNLLMRFYEVDDGRIKVEGQDITGVTRDSLRRSFGMVLQDTWLFAGTIRENIAYGKPDATDEEIEAAARAAHAHSFIRRLPDGYGTLIAEDGGNLSQGQKQLLTIARAMLLDSPMLILDEATSSVDILTEMRIQKAFRKMRGRGKPPLLSPTGCPPSGMRISSWCWTRATWWSREPTASCWKKAGFYAEPV